MLVFKIFLALQCLVLLSCTPVVGQSNTPLLNNDTTINMHGEIGAEGREFNIKILKSNQQIKITYTVNDSINRSALERDQGYKRHYKRFLQGKAFSKGFNEPEARIYISMFKKYQVNSTDSVSFAENSKPLFDNLINVIVSKDLKDLTDRNRVSFDGFTVHFKVETSQKVQEVSVHSPNAKLEPLLTDLISQTVAVYHTFKNRSLLNRTSIKDY